MSRNAGIQLAEKKHPLIIYSLFKKILGMQCLGSARFWLPGSGSGSAKICGSTDPDPRGQKSTKNCKKKTFLLLKHKSERKKILQKFPHF